MKNLKDTARATLDGFFPDEKPKIDTDTQYFLRQSIRRSMKHRCGNDGENVQSEKPFEMAKLLNAANRIRNGKALEPDQFGMKILNGAILVVPREMLRMYNPGLKQKVF